MIDFTSRDTLPKDADGKVLLPLPEDPRMTNFTGDIPPNDYDAILNLLREDWYTCCRYFIDPELLAHEHYGDDCGDYRMAVGDLMALLQKHFSFAMWHSEMAQMEIDELNKILNCADEEHCIHQYSLDGPGTNIERLAVDWESCPLLPADERPKT